MYVCHLFVSNPLPCGDTEWVLVPWLTSCPVMYGYDLIYYMASRSWTPSGERMPSCDRFCYDPASGVLFFLLSASLFFFVIFSPPSVEHPEHQLKSTPLSHTYASAVSPLSKGTEFSSPSFTLPHYSVFHFLDLKDRHAGSKKMTMKRKMRLLLKRTSTLHHPWEWWGGEKSGARKK